VPHRSSDDPTRATRFVWGNDPHKLQVKLLKIDNGGHAEPSISKRTGWLLTKFLGPQNGDVELAEEVWEFFKDKRRGLAP
jgi:polyhydroxybutyrate depolymerase